MDDDDDDDGIVTGMDDCRRGVRSKEGQGIKKAERVCPMKDSAPERVDGWPERQQWGARRGKREKGNRDTAPKGMVMLCSDGGAEVNWEW